MRLYSDWANRRPGEGPLAGGFDDVSSGFDASLRELVDLVEQSVKLSEDARHWKHVAELRRQWKVQADNSHVRELTNRIQEIEGKLTASVTAAIAPLLEEVVVKKGVSDFCEVLKRHFQQPAVQQLTVNAPSSWRAMLAEELISAGIVASIEESHTGEASARVADTEIETDVVKWVQQIRKEAA